MSTKNYSIKDIAAWKFADINLPQVWLDHIGGIAEGSRILIKGDPKHGKTEYMMRLAKALIMDAEFKLNYNSTEQGKSKSFREAFMRNQMDGLPGGKFMLCSKDQRKFETWYRKLQRPNQGNVIVLDSMDYMAITFEQVKLLLERFPNKTIILVSWLVNPLLKKVEHMMDVIVHVKDFKANPISRLGGNKPMVIWNKKADVMKQGELAL